MQQGDPAGSDNAQVLDFVRTEGELGADDPAQLRPGSFEQVVGYPYADDVVTNPDDIGAADGLFEVASDFLDRAERNPLGAPVAVEVGHVLQPHLVAIREHHGFAIAEPDQAERGSSRHRRADPLDRFRVVEERKITGVGHDHDPEPRRPSWESCGNATCPRAPIWRPTSSRAGDSVQETQFRLLATLGGRESDSVLDVGCGSLRAGRLPISHPMPTR